MRFIFAEDATPLNSDEINNLIPKHLTTQAQLNEYEQLNIMQAESWAFGSKRKNILTSEFIQKLHKKMFCNTWKWAGKFRKTQTNIGIGPAFVAPQVRMILDDTSYVIENGGYPIREAAVRLHHRLVFTHPFTNGNGRFCRLFVDLVLFNKNQPRFTWGRANLIDDSKTRREYLEALRAADNHDYSLLISFADS